MQGRRVRFLTLMLTAGAWPLHACTLALERPAEDRTGSAVPGDNHDVPAHEQDAESLAIDACAEVSCAQAPAAALEVFESFCASCHGDETAGAGRLTGVLDLRALVDSGLVIPDDPDNSVLYQRMATNSMPPTTQANRPSQRDIEAVRTWIACGAEKLGDELHDDPFLTSAPEIMRADLHGFSEEERLDMRYLDLSPLARTGLSESQLASYRAALTHLLNSLSSSPAVAIPQAIGIDDQQVLRIRLSEYGWSAATWERIIADYPYAVVYPDTSEIYQFASNASEQVRMQTGTLVPYVQADWFFAHAARPPLYYDILGLPPTLAELETKLDIDIEANIASQAVARAGFRASSVSSHERVIERHAIDELGRALWLTYDIPSDAESSNVLTHPLDFVSAGSELLFELPNGLQAFMIVAAGGARLDAAPSDSLRDPLASGGLTEAGLSCVSCHVDGGIMPVADEVRENASATVTDPTLRAAITALYPDQRELDRLFAADAARYLQARAALGAPGYGMSTAHDLVSRHERPLDLGSVAAVLGLSATELQMAIDLAGDAVPAPVRALVRSIDSTIDRDTLEAVFPDLVLAIGIGQPIRSGAVVGR